MRHHPVDSSDSPEIPLILAHRGASGERPENTLAAFARAIEVGAHGVEVDVQLTKDGAPIVIHDARLDRTTDGSGRISNHTLAELRRLDAGSWFAPTYRRERIPTLGEVLEVVGLRARLINIELKKYRIAYPGLEAKVIEALGAGGLLAKTVISSFNYGSLQVVKAIDPSIQIGYLYELPFRSPVAGALRLGAAAIHPPRLVVTRTLVRRAHEASLRVHVWTVNRPKHFRQMQAYKVDAIFTDQPAAMLELLRGTSGRSTGSSD